ncbi:GNAT family N-acetyltransferase [Pleurocapsa sp. PCC 7319]|uniref:GNAT family N-acetyltransferase n=1 Tax=Pleurocapsa sp. PCC 7319 TaxID=118161 RepID=UPI00034C54DE|nr:GNAT family N-acetyltransferase [Pleurocapsa sp. PCC 7319]
MSERNFLRDSRVRHKYLSDGSSLIIRPVTIEDAAILRYTELAIINAGVGVVQGIEDIPNSDEEYSERLKEILEAEDAERNICFAVSEYEGEVVGYCQIERLIPKYVRHVASISIGVHPLKQGIGIGRALMEYLLDWAKHTENPQIVRVELGVQIDNLRARHLYDSLGFEIEGIRKCFVRNQEGKYVDDCLMALFLEEAHSMGEMSTDSSSI